MAGSLRFISHQEMLRLWQRALIRAGVPVYFSEGFNPHPKISLPLPRSVGLEAQDELACVYVEHADDEPLNAGSLKTRLNEQLPAGCDVLDVEVCGSKTSLRAQGAVYFLPVRPCEKLRTAAENLLSRLAAAEKITVQRRLDENGNSRSVDVSDYIKSIDIRDNGVSVECRISPAGSIRIDEIMSLLQIDVSMLTGAVARTSVQWLQKN